MVSAYSHAMLAASKVMAVMSTNRNVPRDVYDLNDLLACDPVAILASRVAPTALQEIQTQALDKVCAIDFALAQQELLPYIPPAQRDALDSARWDEVTLNVAQAVQAWATQAAAQP
jgi:hypothetical protein